MLMRNVATVVYALSALLLAACGGGGGDGDTPAPANTAPTASIASPTTDSTYAEGSTILLVGSGNDAEDGALSGSALSWFSSRDAALGTGENLSTTLSVGVHDITLTATDSAGSEGTDRIRVIVNGRPVLNRMEAAPDTTTTGVPVTYAWMIDDPEGDTLTCRLDVDGDGTDDYTITDCGNNTTQSHTFTAAGTYTGRLSFEDGINPVRDVMVTVQVNMPTPGNVAPVVNAFTVDQTSVVVGSTVTFSWDVSDADGDTLTCQLDVDGDTTIDYTITDCANNTRQTHVYTRASGPVATLTVSDGTATVRATSIAITVNPNTAPAIDSFTADSTSILTGDTVTFSWNLSDAEGDTLICMLDVDGDTVVDYTIDDCANNTRQSHVYTVAGDAAATLTVSDGTSTVSASPVTITVRGNSAPVISRFDADRAAVATGIAVAFSWDVTDADGDTLTCELDIEDDGTVEYTIDDCAANASQSHIYTLAGSFTARLTVSDGTNTPVSEVFTVAVSNLPVISAFGASPEPYYADIATTFNWQVSDPDGDTLTCLLDADGDGITDYTITDCGNTSTQAHVFTRTMTFDATLTVTDGVSGNISRVFTLNVEPSLVATIQSSAPAVANGRVFYTITVGNVALVQRNNVQVYLDIPDGLSFRRGNDAIPDVYSCTSGTTCNGGATARWLVGDLPAGETRTLTINATVAPTVVVAGNVLTMQLRMTSNETAGEIVKTRDVVVGTAPVSQLALGATPDPVLPGTDMTVTVDAGNIGSTALANTEMRLRIPAGMTVVSISDGGTEDAATGELVWSLGSVAVGGSVHREAVLTVPTDARLGEAFALHAELTHDGGAAVDVVAEHMVTVSAAALPLSLEMVTASNPVQAGGRLAQVVTISNTSLLPVANVSVRLRVPDGVSFRRGNDAIPDLNSCTSGTTCADGAEARWLIGTIEAGGSRTLTINADVAVTVPAGSLLVTTAQVYEGDRLTDTIMLRHTDHVSQAPVSQLSLGATPDPVLPGTDMTVTVDAGNIGSTALANTEMRLRIPAGMTVVSISDGGTEDAATGELVWSLGSVAVGGSVHREAVLTVPTDARLGEAFALHAELTHDGGAAVDVVAEHMVTISAGVPLAVTVNVSPEPVAAGGVVTYTIRVLNTSRVPVDGINVYMRMPDGVSFDNGTDATPSANSCTSGRQCGDGAEARWYFSTLNAGLAQDITISATVSAAQPSGSLLPTNVQVDAAGLEDGILIRTNGRVR